MLLLTDRGFAAGDFFAAVAATRAQFLARLTSITAHISAEHHKPATRRRKSVTTGNGP